MLAIGILLTGYAIAQENDTAVLRKAGVSYIEHRSFMAIYGDRADTCVESKIWVNEYGLTTREIVDHNCTGWDVLNETEFSYDDQHRLVKQSTTHNDLLQNQLSYTYNDLNHVVEFKMMIFEPVMTITSKNQHFYNKWDKADSIYRTSVVDQDTTIQVDRITYDKDHKVRLVNTYNDTGLLILSNEYIYNKDGRLSELNVESTYPEYSYSKNMFTYNEDGQLFSITNTDQGSTIQLWYNKQGLIILASHYNQFGQTVKNIHYKYTYR